MKWWLLLGGLAVLARDPLAQRIAHSDPAKYRKIRSVHAGAGELHYLGMFDAQTFHTNFIFLHRGVIPPGGGIGHHFHNQMEEMFVILDGEAEFTIDGRTSVLRGPAGAPCRMGRSHAIYNPGDKPVEWMNIAVGSMKGKYDATDLGDDRTGVSKDAKPVFINMRLDRTLLKAGPGGVQYRRVLPPEVFYTNWSYVDHVVVPPGAAIGKHRHEGVEEFYYVMAGAGVASVDKEEAAIKKGDAVPVLLNEVHGFRNTSAEPLEMMVVGVARQKWALDSVDVP
ncbi:MAG TPA: cupin domain-containing protein [Bryobacteraceae bacterium]|nr:cupin domain-containing protein [Bryobacteraceae bacterium]